MPLKSCFIFFILICITIQTHFTMKDEIRIMLEKLSFILLYYRYVILLIIID